MTVCAHQKDPESPCFKQEGYVAIVDGNCGGCGQPHGTLLEESRVEARVGAVPVSAVLNLVGIGMEGNQEKVTLAGQDISRFVRRLAIEAEPGELLDVRIQILANQPGHPAVEIPEALANVTVVDLADTIELRNALIEAHQLLTVVLDADTITLAQRVLMDWFDDIVKRPDEPGTLRDAMTRRAAHRVPTQS